MRLKYVPGFVLSILLFSKLDAQTLQFEIKKVCIDSTAIESDAFGPNCVYLKMGVKNSSTINQVIFNDTIWLGSKNMGRLVYFDSVKKRYYYTLIKPDLGYVYGNMDVCGNDSADFIATINLGDLYFYYKYLGTILNFDAKMLTRVVQTGRFFYLPGAYNKETYTTKELPKQAIEINKKEMQISFGYGLLP